MGSRILVADDEARLRKLVKDFLVKEGHDVIEAANGKEALDIFYTDDSIEMLILDVMMPLMDGFEVCRKVRETSSVPVIMLTAKGEESDVLNGYELGADEYVSKPFSPKVLVARVNAVLKRTKEIVTEKTYINAGGIELDTRTHVVTVDNEVIDLSVKEFELLYYFLSNENIALSRETILNHVWDYDYFGDARTIDTHVKKLRSKLGSRGDYIKTIWGMGYKFEI